MQRNILNKKVSFFLFTRLVILYIIKNVDCDGLAWPVRQVVKTPPFHGGFMGSNPVRVTLED
ncbi:MAG: hypothetical protein K0Q56_795 [Sporolactobacillus laevolacticus]|nr:hypothetical protein [Sporolactobacillus laevolacticus]